MIQLKDVASRPGYYVTGEGLAIPKEAKAMNVTVSTDGQAQNAQVSIKVLNQFSKMFIQVVFVYYAYGRGDGATDSASDCCIIRGTVAWFESLTIIRSPKCLVDPDYIIDT